jgi:hypothetical protein
LGASRWQIWSNREGNDYEPLTHLWKNIHSSKRDAWCVRRVCMCANANPGFNLGIKPGCNSGAISRINTSNAGTKAINYANYRSRNAIWRAINRDSS